MTSSTSISLIPEPYQVTCAFLEEIGIHVVPRPGTSGFLHGVAIERGCCIAIDFKVYGAFGNLMHEAGHLAVVPSQFRGHVYGNTDVVLGSIMDQYFDKLDWLGGPEPLVMRALLQAGETEAQAWSYAAAVHTGLDPCIVFDDKIQEGFGDVLLGLAVNSHFGINGMQAAGMTTKNTFPKMIKWVQD
jgi:hypothetical protein